MDKTKLIGIYGSIHTFFTPSGFEVAIREQNGEDDAILSNVSLSREAASINAFIRNIVVGVSNKAGLLSDEDVLNMWLRDKYCILIQSRIFSAGELMRFAYEWVPGIPPTEYEEDLTQFLWDYQLPFPSEGQPNHSPQRIKPYVLKEEDLILELAPDKIITIDYLDGYGESYLLKLPENKTHINSRLFARNIRVLKGQESLKVENFSQFSSREMSKIRTWVDEVDPQFDGLVSIENPMDGTTRYLSMISLPDFFFPREI